MSSEEYRSIDHLKIMWLSQISKQNSFGEVSRVFIELIKNFSKCELYLLDQSNDTNINILAQTIVNLKPDYLIILFNDGNLKQLTHQLSSTCSEINCKIICYCPIEYSKPLKKLLDFKCDICLTMNAWAAVEIEKQLVGYPVRVLEHIVEDFYHFSLNKRISIKKKYYGELYDRYIIGVVNANNARKKLDLSIRAFRIFHQEVPNSLLVIKTTLPINDHGSACVSYRFLRKFMDDIPVIVMMNNITKTELNELYNSFDLVINTTEGEGFGLIPFEAALSGTLSIIPYNSAYLCLLPTHNGEMPRYCVPCTDIPYEYSRNTDDYIHHRGGYDLMYFLTATASSEKSVTETLHQITHRADYHVYTISLKRTELLHTFDNIEKLIEELNTKAICDFEIRVTSDLESLRYYLEWNKEYTIEDFINSNFDITKTTIVAVENYVGENSPHVGIVDINQIADKVMYYYRNSKEKDNDMLELQNHVKDRFTSRAIYNQLLDVLLC